MPRVGKDLLPAFTSDQVTALLKGCETARERALVLFLLDTGVRASEAAAVAVGDVDMATGAVLVRKGKGHKQHIVYLGAKARRQMARYLAERGRPAATEPLWAS